MSSVDDALRLARAKLQAAEARQLLAHQLARPHAWLAAHGEELLNDADAHRYAELVERRVEGWPMAYLTGEREFYGRLFAVTPAVLIPRPETELLVDIAVAKAAGLQAPRCLDLGSGSGCIAVSLALELDEARVTAVDVSAAALALAARNAARHAAALEFVESDWYAALGDRRFDLILANPPYVPLGDPHLDCGDLRFEPRVALSPGADGLAALRRIVSGAPAHLAPGGSLFVEHGYDQAAAVGELFAACAYRDVEQRRDLAGIVRVTGGRAA